MSDVDALAVTTSFDLAEEILDEELDLIESYLGELLKKAVYVCEAEE